MTQIKDNACPSLQPPYCYNYIGLIAWTQGTIHQHNIIIIYTQMERAYCSLDLCVCVVDRIRWGGKLTVRGSWGMDGEATDLCPPVS